MSRPLNYQRTSVRSNKSPESRTVFSFSNLFFLFLFYFAFCETQKKASKMQACLMTLFESQIILAEHECCTNWGDCKSNKSNQILVFEERGKPEFPEKNLSEQRTNKLSPHMTPGPGIEPGTHWWKASALTTAQTFCNFLSCFNFPRSAWRISNRQ